MLDQVQDLLLILIGSSLVSNVVLSQFLGLCPFLGVSKKVETAAGMGTAVIFVITLSSAVAGAIYKFALVPLNITYLQTIVFILVIAALVQPIILITPNKEFIFVEINVAADRKSTRLNSSHVKRSRMPSSA